MMVQNLVEYIVKQLVSQPELVVVTAAMRGDTQVLEVVVDNDDRGKVIGKEGQTIKSIRSLVQAIVPEGKKIIIDLA